MTLHASSCSWSRLVTRVQGPVEFLDEEILPSSLIGHQNRVRVPLTTKTQEDTLLNPHERYFALVWQEFFKTVISMCCLIYDFKFILLHVVNNIPMMM